MDLKLVQALANADQIAFKRHTLLRMYQRVIGVVEVKEALQCCELVEDYPTDRPLPSALVLGYTNKKRPLHVVVATEEEGKLVWAITVYQPDETIWENDFKTRRQS